MIRTVMPRRLGAVVLCSALLAMPASALADDEDGVHPLEANVHPLEADITPLDQETSDGGTRTVTLQSDVLFDTGSSALSEAARAKIAEVAAGAPQGSEVHVDGHTDNVPYARGNDVLSRERAQAVADAITPARPDLRLVVTGYGDTRPVADNGSPGADNPEGRAKNRRVEISYDA